MLSKTSLLFNRYVNYKKKKGSHCISILNEEIVDAEITTDQWRTYLTQQYESSEYVRGYSIASENDLRFQRTSWRK